MSEGRRSAAQPPQAFPPSAILAYQCRANAPQNRRSFTDLSCGCWPEETTQIPTINQDYPKDLRFAGVQAGLLSMEEAMLKRTFICITLIASFFVSPALASGGVEYTEEDEAKAFASRFAISGAEYGTATEAKAMLDRAVAAVKAGKPGAIAMFNHNDSRFRDRDLFVFCFNGQDGKFTAHEAMVAHDVRTL